MIYIGYSFKKLYNYNKHKDQIMGFYVKDTRRKVTEICGNDPFYAFHMWLWYLGLNPKYAFWWIGLKRWLRKEKR